jgi:UPF0755 protein
MSSRDRFATGTLRPPDPPDGRTQSDREAARRERAARRASRSGHSPGAPPGRGPARGPARPSVLPGGGRDWLEDDPGDGAGRFGRDGGPPRGGRARRRTPQPPEIERRRRRLAVVAVIGLLLLVWLVTGFWAPFAGEGDEPVRVRIPKGAGVQQIGDILDERGVVASAAVFSLRVRMTGVGSELKPGNYTLREGMSYGAALAALEEGPARNVVNVTIPEGRARGEVDPIVEQAGLDGSYLRASARSSGLDPAQYGAEQAASLEGFLFPSTYELPRGASASDLVARQLDAFKREFKGVDLSEARRRNLSPYEVLVIASMVEREAQLDKERPLIASVIHNRLRRGEPLGIDATIRYATKNWDRPLTQSQLATASPYNTRTNAGLPPGPIGSPGLESIRAAAKPAQSDYLFYVVKPNTCGEHAFSRTIDEFNRDSQLYNSERAARGGQSPDSCPS